MAKKKVATRQVGKKSPNTLLKNVFSSKKERKEAEARAARAAAEAVLEIEDANEEEEEEEEEDPVEADLRAVDNAFLDTSESDVDKDVFLNGAKIAQAQKDQVKFYIYKNSEFSGTKSYPYSWEKLQKEFGEGHFRIVGKSVKTGRVITTQNELVGPPPSLADRDDDSEVESAPPADAFTMFGFMNQMADKAESKAATAANAQATMMSTIMTTMMQTQQQSQQQFQMMLMEMQKQAQLQQQQQMTLITTLLATPKESGKTDPMMMIKLMQDAEKRAEDRTKTFYELIDKKVEEKAESMEASAPGEEKEESFSKSLIKGFIPILAQLQQGQAAQAQGQLPAAQQLTPEQQAELVRQENERQTNLRLAQDQERDRQEKERAKQKVLAARPKEVANATRKVLTPTELKAKVIGFMGKIGIVQDITDDVTQGVSASNSAEKVLFKLEKAGCPRQTVAEVLTYNDLVSLALENGLPQGALSLAEAWIKEFHAYVDKFRPPVGQAVNENTGSSSVLGASAVAQPVVASPSGEIKIIGQQADGTASGATAKPELAVASRSRTRVEPRKPTQDLGN